MASIGIRRVGGRSGKATEEVADLSESSNYFLRIKTKAISNTSFVNIVNEIDFSSIVNSTAGVRSLSKPELFSILKKQPKLSKLL